MKLPKVRWTGIICFLVRWLFYGWLMLFGWVNGGCMGFYESLPVYSFLPTGWKRNQRLVHFWKAWYDIVGRVGWSVVITFMLPCCSLVLPYIRSCYASATSLTLAYIRSCYAAATYLALPYIRSCYAASSLTLPYIPSCYAAPTSLALPYIRSCYGAVLHFHTSGAGKTQLATTEASSRQLLFWKAKGEEKIWPLLRFWTNFTKNGPQKLWEKKSLTPSDETIQKRRFLWDEIKSQKSRPIETWVRETTRGVVYERES